MKVYVNNGKIITLFVKYAKVLYKNSHVFGVQLMQLSY